MNAGHSSKHEPTVGLIGLGLLGSAIAERLIENGFQVVGFDICEPQRESFAQRGGIVAKSVEEITARCRRILLSLPDSSVVRQVVDQLSSQLGDGFDILDTTTGAPEDTIEIAAEVASLGTRWLDATVVGSSVQMRAREAIMLVGASNGAFQDNVDLMDVLSTRAYHVGPVGSGARMKLVVNLVIGLHRAVLAEGLSLSHAFGFDLSKTLDILMSSSAYSRAMDIKGQKMVQHDFAPQARLSQHLKDVGLLLASGRQHGANLPLSEVHHEILASLQDAGYGQLDNSAVIKAFLPDVDRK